jgi:hypothetical protein
MVKCQYAYLVETLCEECHCFPGNCRLWKLFKIKRIEFYIWFFLTSFFANLSSFLQVTRLREQTRISSSCKSELVYAAERQKFVAVLILFHNEIFQTFEDYRRWQLTKDYIVGLVEIRNWRNLKNCKPCTFLSHATCAAKHIDVWRETPRMGSEKGRKIKTYFLIWIKNSILSLSWIRVPSKMPTESVSSKINSGLRVQI